MFGLRASVNMWPAGTLCRFGLRACCSCVVGGHAVDIWPVRMFRCMARGHVSVWATGMLRCWSVGSSSETNLRASRLTEDSNKKIWA